jgi:hypothetical protein
MQLDRDADRDSIGTPPSGGGTHRARSVFTDRRTDADGPEEERDMSDLAVTRAGSGYGRTALVLAVASLLLYIGGGFAFGGIFWVLGPLVGLAAIVLGVAARRNSGGREATIAIVLAAVPVLWVAAFMIVAALD